MNHPAIDHRTKGIPGGTAPFSQDAIHEKGWNVLRQDLPLPLAILHEPAIANNARWMREFCETAKVSLAPHGKTTMCPQLFRRQLDDGAWAITLSTAHQVQVARDFGVDRILLANQIVDPRFLDFVMSELDAHLSFDFLCLVDSVEGARIAGEHIKAGGYRRRLGVLIEIGADNGRTGARSVEQALAIADAVVAYSGQLELRGIEGFEGIFGGPPEGNIGKVTALMERITATVLAFDRKGLFTGDEVVLSAGGSAYYDIVLEHLLKLSLSVPTRIVMRSGCYITHDAIMYREYFASLNARSERVRAVSGVLIPALQVVTYVQSLPEPGLALLTGGKRDLSFDVHLPAPSRYYRPGEHSAPVEIGTGHEIYALADQHAFMRIPADSPLRIGDMVILDISHPCTTFDKWDVIYGVDADFNVTMAYKTYF
jgi:D-serine dehydratase